MVLLFGRRDDGERPLAVSFENRKDVPQVALDDPGVGQDLGALTVRSASFPLMSATRCSSSRSSARSLR
jgi:hypothetical protein